MIIPFLLLHDIVILSRLFLLMNSSQKTLMNYNNNSSN